MEHEIIFHKRTKENTFLDSTLTKEEKSFIMMEAF